MDVHTCRWCSLRLCSIWGAIVDKVIDKYVAEVEVMESRPKAKDSADILRIDQDNLETVVPKEIGEKVVVK
jgi:hypothetical protein